MPNNINEDYFSVTPIEPGCEQKVEMGKDRISKIQKEAGNT